MVELVDAPDSKSGGSNTLRVRVSLRPPVMDISKINSLVELFFENRKISMVKNHFLNG